MGKIEKIACCTAGIGTCMMTAVNVEEVLRMLGREDIETGHMCPENFADSDADLLVIDRSLEGRFRNHGNVIVLDELLSMQEIRQKLEKKLAGC